MTYRRYHGKPPGAASYYAIVTRDRKRKGRHPPGQMVSVGGFATKAEAKAALDQLCDMLGIPRKAPRKPRTRTAARSRPYAPWNDFPAEDEPEPRLAA
jgi:hypothetical protein